MVLALLLAVSVADAAPPQTADSRQALAVEISFLASRIDRDPADPVTPTRLGDAYMRHARETGEFESYLDAEKAFMLALSRSKDHFGAVTGLARVRAAVHRFNDALTLGERAIALEPETADGYAIAGDAALELGQLDKAQAFYVQVAKRTPGYHAETRLANLAAARGDVSGAYAALERAARDAAQRGMSEDLRAWVHVRAGSIAFDHGDFERAEKSYDAALQLTPDSFAALEHMAELRAAQGRFDDALALYGKAIARSFQPEFVEAVGRIHQRLGRKDEAEQSLTNARIGFEKAAAQGDPGAYRSLALLLAETSGRAADAVKWAHKDLELRRDPVGYGVLAWTLLKAGLRKEAATAANAAIDAVPMDAITWYRAGVVAMEAGDRKAARERLSRALVLNPRLADAEDARARIKKLTKTD